MGAPVLFAAQDGALPEKHRQELLQARDMDAAGGASPWDVFVTLALVAAKKGTVRLGTALILRPRKCFA